MGQDNTAWSSEVMSVTSILALNGLISARINVQSLVPWVAQAGEPLAITHAPIRKLLGGSRDPA